MPLGHPGRSPEPLTLSSKWCPRCVCAQSPEPHRPPIQPCLSSRCGCSDPGDRMGEDRGWGGRPRLGPARSLRRLTLAQLAKSHPFRNTSRARTMSGRKWSGRSEVCSGKEWVIRPGQNEDLVGLVP